MQTLKRSFANRVQSEVDIAVETVETNWHDTFLAAMDNLVAARVEPATKSINAFPGRGPESVVFDLDEKFPGKADGPHAPLQAG